MKLQTHIALVHVPAVWNWSLNYTSRLQLRNNASNARFVSANPIQIPSATDTFSPSLSISPSPAAAATCSAKLHCRWCDRYDCRGWHSVCLCGNCRKFMLILQNATVQSLESRCLSFFQYFGVFLSSLAFRFDNSGSMQTPNVKWHGVCVKARTRWENEPLHTPDA